jgi:hypothetical protein
MTDRPLNLPPVDAFDTPKLRRAAAEYGALGVRLRDARATVARLDDERRGAVARDRQALADALRSGKPDSGDQHVRAHDDRLDAARREAEALAVAVADARRELVALIDQHAERERDAIPGGVAQARADLGKLVEDVAAVHDRLAADLGFVAWATRAAHDGPDRGKYVPGARGVEALPGINGEPTPWPVVLDALRAIANPPEPTPTPSFGAPAETWQKAPVGAVVVTPV